MTRRMLPPWNQYLRNSLRMGELERWYCLGWTEYCHEHEHISITLQWTDLNHVSGGEDILSWRWIVSLDDGKSCRSPHGMGGLLLPIWAPREIFKKIRLYRGARWLTSMKSVWPPDCGRTSVSSYSFAPSDSFTARNSGQESLQETGSDEKLWVMMIYWRVILQLQMCIHPTRSWIMWNRKINHLGIQLSVSVSQ